MVTFGPWRPYTQTIEYYSLGGLNDGLVMDGRGTTGVLAYFDGAGFVGYLYLDVDMRICSMRHIQFGSPVPVGEYSWDGTCPALVPDVSTLGPPGIVGMVTSYRVDLQSFQLSAAMGQMWVTAQTSLSHGMPAWQDPANDHPPPETEWDPSIGTFRLYEYEPFHAINATLTYVPGPSHTTVSGTVTKPLDIYIREVSYATAWAWSPGGGSTRATISIDTGRSVSGGGSIDVPDLTAGFRANVVPSYIVPGHFDSDDPGYDTTGTAWPNPMLTIRRYGRRRRSPDRITNAAPLHQRQRSDGLVGPVRSSLGPNSRQVGLFQRGIY
jgi:hypothetical protein